MPPPPSVSALTVPSRPKFRVSMPETVRLRVRSRSSPTGGEAVQELGVGSGAAQAVEQLVERLGGGKLGERATQRVGGGELVRVHQKVVATGAGRGDVDRGEHAAFGDAAVEPEFGVAGALVLLEQHAVADRTGVDERAGDDRERTGRLGVARGAEQPL